MLYESGGASAITFCQRKNAPSCHREQYQQYILDLILKLMATSFMFHPRKELPLRIMLYLLNTNIWTALTTKRMLHLDRSHNCIVKNVTLCKMRKQAHEVSLIMATRIAQLVEAGKRSTHAVGNIKHLLLFAQA